MVLGGQTTIKKMSYEAEMYDGLEDLALEAVKEQKENGFYVVLIGYKSQCKTLIDYPFATIEEARKGTMSYKGKCKTAYITKGKPAGFEK